MRRRRSAGEREGVRSIQSTRHRNPRVAFADRLNPILVREIVRTLSSRKFVVLSALVIGGGLAALAPILIRSGAAYETPGGEALANIDLYVWTPITTAALPMSVYLSVREDLGGARADGLRLARVDAKTLLHGHMLATLVRLAAYGAILSPIAAFAFILRGVSFEELFGVAFRGLVAAVFTARFAAAFGRVAARGTLLSEWRGFAGLVVAGGISLLLQFSARQVGLPVTAFISAAALITAVALLIPVWLVVVTFFPHVDAAIKTLVRTATTFDYVEEAPDKNRLRRATLAERRFDMAQVVARRRDVVPAPPSRRGDA